MNTPEATPSKEYVLEMRHISKAFPGVQALQDVTLRLRQGEILALVGENGAGKSTLVKILAGALPADEGEIFLEGRQVNFSGPLDAIKQGVAVIYQEFNLVPEMSVAENIFLGREPKNSLGLLDYATLYREADAYLQRLQASFDSRALVRNLSVANQQLVEIAKALSQQARILVMDEPSAALTEHELDNLFVQMRQLKQEGVSIIYISHRLEEIFEIADRCTVLRDGRHVVNDEVKNFDRDSLIKHLVGRELSEQMPKVKVEPGEELLRVEHLERAGVLHDISFSVRAGEVVGLAGLVGAGRTELARCIFGADKYTGGQIYFEDAPVTITSPRQAIKLGLGLVPEDRKLQGLILEMVVRENITLANLEAVKKLGLLSLSRERLVAESFISSLNIRPPYPERAAKHLSGGNQQKVVLAKWLFTQSKVLIFDEPTRGIDVGAKAEIYNLINELVAKGAGVLMISSELPEVLGMSDRILVMHQGRLAGELKAEEATQEKVMQLATGGTLEPAEAK